MKLVFLYGPPAVGKLTVAKELSKITGYKIFHNHLTIDPVESIFPWGTKAFDDLVNKYRLDLIEAAAANNVSLIFTFVYGGEGDDRFVGRVMRRVQKHGGEVCFVQLRSELSVLKKRMKHPSRKQFRKMKKLKTLKEVMKRHDLFLTVPYRNNITIDNTDIPAKRVAQKIKLRFKL